MDGQMCYRHTDKRDLVLFPAEHETLLSTTVFGPTIGLNRSPVQWVPGFPSPVVKRPGSEDSYSNAKVINKWTCNIISPYAFTACTGSTVLSGLLLLLLLSSLALQSSAGYGLLVHEVS
jgi:hypothetical protein